jgi:glycosyltransferase involved in cell wall biosynthesis
VRILALHSELGVLWGGGETFTTNLLVAFADRGHQVTAAFVADRRGRYPRTLPGCFEILPVSGWWSRKLGQAALSSFGAHLPGRLKPEWDRLLEALCWRTIRWHNDRFHRRIEDIFASQWQRYDAVYVHGNVGLAHGAALHRPTLLMLPGPVSDDCVPQLRNVHAVCAHDDGLSCMRSLLGDDAIELPLGLDSQLFSPGPSSVRKELGWSDGDLVIGYVGRLAFIKGVDLLAAAFGQIAKVVPNARLLVVGSGEEEQKLRSVLSKEFADGTAHVQGSMSQDQLPRWYRAMDTLVMPSRYETLSNAVLEAMACGVPFVASAVGGSRDLAKTNAGWLFEPESVPSLNRVLSSVIDNRAELKARGDRGRQYVQQHYSWQASAVRLENIIASRLGVRE